MGSKRVLSVAASLAIWACGGENAEIGEHQSPLLTVHGMVATSQRPLNHQLVPALMFTPYMTSWGHTQFIVSGDMEGAFPKDFTLRIYDHLPSDALTTLTRGEPAIAIGGITAVSPNHPGRLEWHNDTSGNSVVCSEQGECVQRAALNCDDAYDSPCIGTIAPNKPWGDHGVAGSFIVLYLAEPAAAGGIYSQFFAQGEEIPAGYNIIRHQSVIQRLDANQQSNHYACVTRATSSALEQFNLDHGTSYTDYNAIGNGGRERNVQLLADWDGAMIASTVNEGCLLPDAQQLVQSSNEMLRLVLVDWTGG